MKKTGLLIIITIGIYTLGSLACIPNSNDWGTIIKGNVYEIDSITPITGVAVYRFEPDLNLVTDSTGAYFFYDFGYGPFILHAHKEGYQIDSITVIASDKGQVFENQNIYLNRITR